MSLACVPNVMEGKGSKTQPDRLHVLMGDHLVHLYDFWSHIYGKVDIVNGEIYGYFVWPTLTPVQGLCHRCVRLERLRTI